MVEFTDPMIFMCSLPFLGYFSAYKSFMPTMIMDMLSVEPLIIASYSKTSPLLPSHYYPLAPFS